MSTAETARRKDEHAFGVRKKVCAASSMGSKEQGEVHVSIDQRCAPSSVPLMYLYLIIEDNDSKSSLINSINVKNV